MRIFTNGVHFQCKCGIVGDANVASDFSHIKCNNEDIFAITCPNCGEKLNIDPEDIPEHIRQHIRLIPSNSICSHHF